MDFFTKALSFITVALEKDGKAASLKNEVFDAFIEWVTPLFLKEETTPEMLDDATKNKDEENTESQLKKLLKDDEFRTELEGWINQLQKTTYTEKNILEDTEVEVEKDVVIGDKTVGEKRFTKKNIVKKAKIKAGGKFRLGDG